MPYTKSPDGQQTYKARDEKEIDKLGSLIKSAIGFKSDRGDKVEVVNMQFATSDDLFGGPEGARSSTYDFTPLVYSALMLAVFLTVFALVARPFITGSLGIKISPEQTQQEAVQKAVAKEEAKEEVKEETIEEVSALDKLMDIGKIEGKVKSSSIKKINEIIEKHPTETVSTIRYWLRQKG